MFAPFIETARRTLSHRHQVRELSLASDLQSNIFTQSQDETTIFIDARERPEHSPDHLSLPERIIKEIGPHNVTRLDQVREAFVGIKRDLLLRIDDDMVERNEAGKPTSITLEVFSQARNKKGFITDNEALFTALNIQFTKDAQSKNKKAPHIFQSTFNTDEEGYWSIFNIQPNQPSQLPININFFQLTHTNLDQELERMRHESDNTFACYQVHAPETPSPKNISIDEKIDLLQRNPQCFFDNLTQADLTQVNRILFAIDSELEGITQSEVAIIAEGSATVLPNYTDIDLRIFFAKAGKNVNKKDDNFVNEIADELRNAFKRFDIPATPKRETNYRRFNPLLGTEILIVQERSFEIQVPETGKFIQVSIARSPLEYLEDIYTSAPDRTDLPVVLNTISDSNMFKMLKLKRPQHSKKQPKIKP